MSQNAAMRQLFYSLRMSVRPLASVHGRICLMRQMFQMTLSDREPGLSHNVHCPADHLFRCAEGLLQFEPLRLSKLSLYHALHVMCSDVELPAQDTVLSE